MKCRSVQLCFALMMLSVESVFGAPGATGLYSGGFGQRIEKCCTDGTLYARNNTSNDCKPLVLEKVDFGLEHLCSLAMRECCYSQKHCDTGIEMALDANKCDGAKHNLEKTCCDRCLKGNEAGTQGQICSRLRFSVAIEESLSNEAYTQCCEKSSKMAKRTKNEPKNKIRSIISLPISTSYSKCEEFAPNELCAHHCIAVPGSFRCECNPGFRLMADEKNCKEDYKSSPKKCKTHNPCQQKCNDIEGEIKCSCRKGYLLMADKKSCSDIDECKKANICPHGTKCKNYDGSYKCISSYSNKGSSADQEMCPPGYAKNLFNGACDDVDECQMTRPPCPVDICQNTIGAYKCDGVSGDPRNLDVMLLPLPLNRGEYKCPPGYKTVGNEQCEDIDECKKANICPHGTKCKNYDAYSKCEEFAPNELCAHHCIAVPGSFRCECNPGFRLMADKKNCIEDYKSSPKKCKTHNPCQQKCNDIEGEIKCSCRKGYLLMADKKSCSDVDECQMTRPPCPVDICQNTIGAYKCDGVLGDPRNLDVMLLPLPLNRGEDKCPPGYKTVGNEQCEDEDECVTHQDNCNQKSQFCINTKGSFYCQDRGSKHCPQGFKINNKSFRCEDIDECLDDQSRCPPGKVCVNEPGGYDCKGKEYKPRLHECPDGMRKKHGSTVCEDINECVEGTHMCDQYQTCINTNGSHECHCKAGFKLDELVGACIDVNECLTDQNNCIPWSQRCDNTIGSFLCIRVMPCGTGYILQYPSGVCEDIDECALGIHNCENQSTPYMCVNIPGSFLCVKQETTPPVTTPKKIYYDDDYYYDSDELTTTTHKSTPFDIYLQANVTIKKINELPVENKNKSKENKEKYDIEDNNPKNNEIEVTKETGTVSGVKMDDGTVMLDTKNIPKNVLTKMNEKPDNACQLGFEMDVNGACVDIDECATNRHVCKTSVETCHNNIGGYVCECSIGFRRELHSNACIFAPITPSVVSTLSSGMIIPTTPTTSENHNKGTFRPFKSSYLCDVGYIKNPDTGICEDMNECINYTCATGEVCINTNGSFKCDCEENWELDAVRQRCVPKSDKNKFPKGYGNMPKSSAGNNQNHVETTITGLGNRPNVVKCPRGYKLTENNTCQDKNECLIDPGICGEKQCRNLPGSYACMCPPGHNLSRDQTCHDVDECDLAGDTPICSQNAECINTIGSYKCQCHEGFQNALFNDKVCMDVDECELARSGPLCQHTCNNILGGYYCSCHQGYKLNADNKTCSDINECEQFKDKRLCMGKCLNVPGSYNCTCPNGFRLSEDKRKCHDIDECKTGDVCHSANASGLNFKYFCQNNYGSYKCLNVTCPQGYVMKNLTYARCIKMKRCPMGDWNCTHEPATISYNYYGLASHLNVSKEMPLYDMRGNPNANAKFKLRLTNVVAPPNIKKKADIKSFALKSTNWKAVFSLVESLEGPQSIELEITMKQYDEQNKFNFKGISKQFIEVSEYDSLI